jgi:prepilin-type N-terminal cleavage/methylation domain-containing protein
MKLKLNSTQGLTLLEIIVSLAILSIVLVAFLSLFSNGFITIISMGNKSRASIEAQEIIDRIYAEVNFTTQTELRQGISAIINQVEPGSYDDYTDKISDFDEPNNSNKKIRFYVSNPQAMLIKNAYVVTLRVYYHNYTRNVTISSPIVR